MKMKKLLAVGLTFILLVAGIINSKVTAQAANDSIKLIVDDEIKDENLQTVLVEDKLFLPMDTIAKALSASGTLDQSLQKYSIIYKDMFVELSVGNPSMQYGYITIDGVGRPNYNESKTFLLDAAPILVDNIFFAPFSVISEAFGETISWSKADNSVYISTLHPTPTPTIMPIETAFDDTAQYHKTTLKRVEELRNSDISFVFATYDSSAEDAATMINNIKAAAQEVGYKVYGVDIKDDTNSAFLKSINNIENAKPSIYFHFSKEFVEFIENPKDKDELIRMISSVKNLTFSKVIPVPSPNVMASPSPEPTSTTSPLNVSSGNWNVISRETAETKFKAGDKFIYVYYNSAETKIDDEKLLLIKNAAEKANIPVYVSDFVNNTGYWFGWEYSGHNYTGSPSVYFIKAINSVSVEIRPNDVERLSEMMRFF